MIDVITDLIEHGYTIEIRETEVEVSRPRSDGLFTVAICEGTPKQALLACYKSVIEGEDNE